MATHPQATHPEQSPQPAGEHHLAWSKWSRCESSFSLLLVPPQPGIYAVAEETGDAQTPSGKRILAMLQFAEANDLSRALGRLFTPASPLYERIATGRCFVRYAVVEDPLSRAAAANALQEWLSSSAETLGATTPRSENGNCAREVNPPAPLPAGF